MAVTLTAGAIPLICSGEQLPNLKPVLQVIDCRMVPTQTKPAGAGTEIKERYRLQLSDGTYSQQGMLVTQLNDLIRSQQLQKGSIVQLVEYVCNRIKDRQLVKRWSKQRNMPRLHQLRREGMHKEGAA